MKFRNTWFIISIIVMSIGVFYLVVQTLLVVGKSNSSVRQKGRTLSEVLTDEELTHLNGLVAKSSITPDWIRYVFVPRLANELQHIDWIEGKWRDIDFDDPKYARHREAYDKERAKVLASMEKRRTGAFELALHPSVFQRVQSELQSVYRAFLTGEVADRWNQYLERKRLANVAQDVAESIVTFIPRGIATTVKIFSTGGFGEHPVKSLSEISVAMPSVIALVSLILRILRQIVLPFILSMPNILWNFILDRVRELGRAIRGEE